MRSEPTLHSERLVLRSPIPSDAEAIVALLGNDRHAVEQTAAIPWPVTREGTLAWIAAPRPPDVLRWCVLLQPDGPLIGAIGGTLAPPALSIGYWMGAPYRRHGYTREAVACLLEHAGSLGVRTVTAEVFEGNTPSANLLRSMGFRYTHTVIEHYPVRGGSKPTGQYVLTLVDRA